MPYDDPYRPSWRMCFEPWVQRRFITEVEHSAVGGLASYATTQSFKMAGMHIQEAIDIGCRLYSYTCPLCHLNLDSRQPEVEKVIGRKLGLPVLHLPQLIALALVLNRNS